MEKEAEEDGLDDPLLKLIIIGDAGVGKTSLLARFVDDDFADVYDMEAQPDFKTRTIVLESRSRPTRVKMQIWDRSSKTKGLVGLYEGVDGVIVVYDMTDANSFDNLHHWLDEAEEYADEHVHKLLVGTKSDLSDQLVVPSEQGHELADLFGFVFAEVSAKSGDGVEGAFDLLAEQCVP